MTERKLASIRTIVEVRAIPNADRIVAYRVDGWWVFDAINKYKVGDSVVYCEPDSWIPTALAPFLSKGKEPREFNGILGEKLRTIKLKKQLSQGLLLPLDSLKPYIDDDGDLDFIRDCNGMDVTAILGIQKWEAPINAQLAGIANGSFPSFGRKTDQERIQNLVREFEEWKDQKLVFEITEKLEGSSCSIYYNNGEFGVCSRNLDLLETEGNSFWKAARSLDLEENLRTLGRNLMIQGELIGESIQGNIYRLTGHELQVFDIWDIDTQNYLASAERLEIACMLGLNHAPIVGVDSIGGSDTVDIMLMYAEGLSKLKGVQREGLVFKCVSNPSISFKCISNAYLLKQN